MGDRLSRGSESKRKALEGALTGAFLIGLAVLFYRGALWPWILALVGALLIGEALIRYYYP